jgi:hypothetical protein
MYLISRGTIRENEIQIIKYLKKYKFMTSSQIRRMLGLNEYDKHLRKKLETLKKNRIIFRFSWSLEEGKPSVMKGFSIDIYGYKMINDYLEEKFDWKMEDNLKSMETIFSHFIFNEVVIKANKSLNYIDSFCDIKHIGTGTILMNSKNGQRPYVFLSARKSNGWDIKFKEKISEIISFLSNGWQSHYDVKPVFIIIGEDKEHIISLAKMIIDLSGSVDINARLGIRYTTDEFIAQYSLTEAFASMDILDGEFIVNRILAKVFE